MKVRITKVPDKNNEPLNAAKWHGDGGLIERFGVDAVRKALANKYATGGPEKKTIEKNEEGGYDKQWAPQEYREGVAKAWDPAGTWNLPNWIYSKMYGNQSRGEENEYWRAYLGLEHNVPKMQSDAKTEWDDKMEAEKIASEKPTSDFYGTTPRMNQIIESVADTLNIGRILRDYDTYKATEPSLADKETLELMYDQGKRVLGNPGKWIQVGEQRNKGKQLTVFDELDAETNERYPLGMLGQFGMKWDPDTKTLRVHDTYDFPWYVRANYLSTHRIPKRPKEMKIRSSLPFDPAKGSTLLRDGNLHKEKIAKPIADKNTRK